MFHFLTRPLLVLTLVFVLASIPSTLFAQATPPFQFDSVEPIVLQWADFATEGADVVVLNNVGQERTLNVQMSDIALKTGEGIVLRNSVRLRETTINLQTMATVHLEPASEATRVTLAPATYHGYLSLTDSDADVTAHRPIIVKVAAPGEADAGALVDTWSVAAYRFPVLAMLFTESCDEWTCFSNGYLPVAAEFAGRQFKGTLTNAGGGMALAWTSGEATDIPSLPNSPYQDIKTVPLRFDHLNHPGVYSGKLAAIPGAEDGQINTTVLVKHDPLWPIIALLLSGAVAFALKHFNGNRRKKLELRRDVEALTVALQEVQKGIEPDRKLFRGYTVKDSLAAKQEELKGQIRQLPKLTELDDNEDYKQIRKDIDDNKALISAWAELPKALDELERSLGEVVVTPILEAKFQEIVPWENRREPAFLDQARRLLIGEPIAIDMVPELSSKINKTAKFATLWNELNERLWRLIKKLEEIGREIDPKLYDKVNKKLREIFHELWRVRTAEELATLETEADLKLAEQIIDQLSQIIDSSKFAVTEMPSELIREIRWSERPDDISPREVVAHYDSIILRWDWLFFLLTIVIAVLSGLQALYINKPFGTLVDYIAVILWAFAATVLLDGIVSALDRVLTSRLLDQRLPRL